MENIKQDARCEAVATSQCIAVTYRNTHELKCNPKNARMHSKSQIAQIAKSLKCFGFVVPILIDQHDQIVAGHGRLLAARQLNLAQIPTIRLEHLSPEELMAFTLADNRLAENATWDDRLLAEQLSELSKLSITFDLSVTGFSLSEIDLKIESLNCTVTKSDSADPADVVPTRSTIAVSQVNDLWLIGPHRVYCGNSLEASSYAKVMDGKLASMCLTDVPFNVKISGHVSGNGKIQHREFAMGCGEMSPSEYVSFLTSAFGLMAQHSVSGSIHFHFIDWRHVADMLAAGETAYTELKNICIWDKGSPGMGSLYRSQHEMVCVFKSGDGKHINNIMLGKHGRNRTNVWCFPGVNSFARASNDEGNLLALHPTCKSVAMLAEAMLDCSHRGDIILDPFLGSGTSIMVAERVGRICYGIELDPLYVDTIIRRYQAYHGQQAVHALTGKTFNERAACATSNITSAEVCDGQ